MYDTYNSDACCKGTLLARRCKLELSALNALRAPRPLRAYTHFACANYAFALWTVAIGRLLKPTGAGAPYAFACHLPRGLVARKATGTRAHSTCA